MKECNCDLRTRVLGDGCDTCNPEQALGYARETIEELRQERDELAAQVDVMRDALNSAKDILESWDGCCTENIAATFDCSDELGAIHEALSITPSAALREIQASTLESVRDYLNHEGHSEAALLVHEEAAAIRKGE